MGSNGDERPEPPIDTIAVTFEDLISALEVNEQGATPGRAVLRLTPPFHGRMRARLHIEHPDEYTALDGPAPIHLPPRTLLDHDVLAPYPDAEQTRERIEARSDTYTVDDHYTAHRETLAEWRSAVRRAVLTSTTIQTPGGSIEVTISVLD